MQKAFDTQFWGPIRVLKGALPQMRARKSGTIVYISSIFGFYSCPSLAMYSGPKAASDMLQQSLAIELAPFNIRTLSIVAGLYRTGVLTNSKKPANGFSEATMAGAVAESLGHVGKIVADPQANMPGDPAKFGQRIVEIVDGTGLGKGLEKCSNFLFGRDAVKMSAMKMQKLAEDFAASNAIAHSTDFEGHTSDGVYTVAEIVQGI